MLLTLDSSVIVASLLSSEASHEHSQELLRQVYEGHHQVILPYSVLVEVVAAIRRRTGSEQLASLAQHLLGDLPQTSFVDLEERRASAAVGIALQTGLRGMDALVVQVAHEHGAALVTLDDEIVSRADSVLRAVGPDEAMLGRT